MLSGGKPVFRLLCLTIGLLVFGVVVPTAAARIGPFRPRGLGSDLVFCFMQDL